MRAWWWAQRSLLFGSRWQSQELKAYFGFMILMGMNNLQALIDYWNMDTIYHYAAIAGCIYRKFLISGDTHPTYDKLGKVRPIINHFKVRKGRVASEWLSYFKMLIHSPHPFWRCSSKCCSYQPATTPLIRWGIPFRGRSRVKQYMPKKPIKRAIKVWVRADSASDFDVYVASSASPEKAIVAGVVPQLTRSFVKKSYHITC